MSKQIYVGLLRGINVGGHNRIPMTELRSLCGEIGWDDVRSYIQSGNLVFSASAKPARLEAELEKSIERHFGLQVPVLVRTTEDWRVYTKSNPFPKASLNEPNLVGLALSKRTPDPKAAEKLRERAADGERLTQVGDALWIHFKNGSARSKLSPALLDRIVGSTVTVRNWRTVLKIQGLAGSRSSVD